MCVIDWTAIWTGVLAFVAFGSFWLQWYFSRKQIREARESFDRSIDAQHEVSRIEIGTRLYLEMTDRLDSRKMRAARKRLALQILRKAPDDEIDEDVMNFYEDMGALFFKGRMDEVLSYSGFSYDAIRWWAACEPYIRRQRAGEEDPTFYEHFEAFASRMRAVDVTERKIDIEKATPDAVELFAFMQDESTQKD